MIQSVFFVFVFQIVVTITNGFSPSPLRRLPTTQPSIIRGSIKITTLFVTRERNANSRSSPSLEQKPPMNEEITAPELRVLTPNSRGKDEPLGILSRTEALAKAKELGGLDLILVNPNSDPPVCKIVDYSKYRYMQEKKAKEVKKNSKASEIKEVKMSYKIDIHDYEVRKKSALKFLKQGNRVKCSVMFRGREVQHDKLGFDLLNKLATEMEKVCVRESQPKREGRNLAMIVSPRPEVLKAVNDNRRATEKAKKKKKSEEKEQRAAAAAAISSSELGASAEWNGSVVSGDSEEDDDDDDDDDDDGDGDDDDDDDDDLLDIEADIESSLDDLFGSDDLTDDLFS
jgi:translation initiation factor IF-3